MFSEFIFKAIYFGSECLRRNDIADSEQNFRLIRVSDFPALILIKSAFSRKNNHFRQAQREWDGLANTTRMSLLERLNFSG